MHNTIYKISIEINNSLDKHLISLRAALTDGLIKEKEFVGMYMLRNLMVKNGDEKKLYKLFRLIEQLFEKLIESDHTKSSQKEDLLYSYPQSPIKAPLKMDLPGLEGEGMMLEPITGENPTVAKISPKQGEKKTKRTPNRNKAEELKVFEKVKDRVRQRFENLLDDKNLNSLWLNLIEV